MHSSPLGSVAALTMFVLSCEPVVDAPPEECGGGCVSSACAVDADCAGGEVCLHHTRSTANATCEAPAARGEVCSSANDTGERFDKSCAAALECVLRESNGFTTDSVCVPVDDAAPRLLAEPCSTEGACADGLVCDVAGETRICRLPEGASCDSGAQCASGFCPSVIGTCAPDECRGLFQECADPSLFCAGGDCGRTCEPLGNRGDECARATSDVDPCAVARRCDAGLDCVQLQIAANIVGTCLPPDGRSPGEPCSADAECASLSCGIDDDACN